MTDLLAVELNAMPAGSARGRAHLFLSTGVVRNNDQIREHLEQALAEGGSDAALRAAVLARMAENTVVIRVERIPEAEGWARKALNAAPGGDPRLERLTLYALSWARSLRGRRIDDLCARFPAASETAFSIVGSTDRVAGKRLLWRGEVENARAVLAPLLSLADERGEPYSYALLRLHMCELELRVGHFAAAELLLDEWAESSDSVIWPMYERCRALLAAGRGLPEEAERWAAKALAAAEVTGNRWDSLESLRARGLGALLAHDLERAAESLRAVWEHTQREGVEDPGVFPVAPELVEALIEIGEPGEASIVTERLRELAQQQEHPWGLATATRCESLVRFASHTDEEAATADLEHAVVDYGLLGLEFDRARTLLLLGRARRRRKKWAAASANLDRAAAAFDALGSPGWAEEARSELARIGAHRPRAAGELTESEQRVVELAVEGLANKEIARKLFVTVNTVETHLSHAYAKLGIRSRAQLARRLATE